ncbi:MAG TPA: 2-dehydropantoate 2-reductase [Terriglobales bacterium]|nr:2-dehydropantoate 2-reductase [Terriglobales bacterium]
MARILVAGAGALGSVFGGFLQRDGHAVTLLGRREHLQAISRSGLHLEGLWGDHCVRGFELCSDPPRGRCFDAILVTVKSYDTAAVGRQVAPLLAADGVMISLQNGLGNVETLLAAVGEDRVLGGRVIFGAVLPEPGRARVTVFAEPTLLGAWPIWEEAIGATRWPRQAAAQAEQWAGVIARAGVPCQASADVRAALWAKVFYNAALNPLGALLRVHYGALGEQADTRAIMDGIIDEAFAIAQREGVPLRWQSAAAYRELFYGQLVPSTYRHRSSMLQDLERGRRTEIEAINGALWRYAAAHAMNAPFNELITRLIRAREAVQ